MGGEKLKWCQLAHHQLMSKPKTSFSPHSTAKTNDKSISEITRLKKTIMNKLQETNGFWRAPEIDFRCETKARKEMVDFKFDALYR